MSRAELWSWISPTGVVYRKARALSTAPPPPLLKGACGIETRWLEERGQCLDCSLHLHTDSLCPEKSGGLGNATAKMAIAEV
jgi:hypothetical protein